MSNLSDLLPAGASGKTIEAVATATITTKKPVILNSAGTVTEVAETSISEDFPIGSVQQIDPGGGTNVRTPATYDVNNMVPMVGESNTYIECLTDSSLYPCIAVCKLSDANIISHGTQTIINSVASSKANIANDPTLGSRGMVTFVNTGDTIQGKVYTITGTGTSTSDYTVTLGSATTVTTYMNAGNVSGLWFDPHTSGRFVYMYNWNNGAASGMQKFMVTAMGLVTGTGASGSIGSVDEKTYIDSVGASYYYSSWIIGWDPNTANKLLCAYGIYGLPFPTSPYDRIQAKVGILSSSTDYTPTWGTAVVFNSASSNDTSKSMAWLHQTADRAIAFYQDGSSGSDPCARMLTIGPGTATTITVGGTNYADPSYGKDNRILVQAADDSFVTFWNENSGNKGWFRSGTINTSTGTVTWGTKTRVNPDSDKNQGTYAAMCFDGANNGKFYFYGRQLAGNDDKNWVSVNQMAADVTNLTSTNFVGIADAGIATSATGTVVVQGGTVTGLSSLTAGSKYYVQNDGTITTVSSSVNAGLAISTTALLLNGDS